VKIISYRFCKLETQTQKEIESYTQNMKLL